MTANYKWTIRLGIIAPILLLICLLLMGGGHGWYTPAVILFPCSTFNTTWQDHLSIPLFFGGMIQYPLYGLVIDRAKPANRLGKWIIVITAFHLILVILILWLRNSEWR